MKLLNALLKVSGLTRLSYAKPRHRRYTLNTSNSARFLVDILEHFIDINDRSHDFNTMLHVIKDTERYKAGSTIFIHIFEDVNGFDRPSLTEWRDGQHIRTRISN